MEYLYWEMGTNGSEYIETHAMLSSIRFAMLPDYNLNSERQLKLRIRIIQPTSATKFYMFLMSSRWHDAHTELSFFQFCWISCNIYTLPC